MKFHCLLLAMGLEVSRLTLEASLLTGRVTENSASNVVSAARVTMFTSDLQLFREVRSAVDGTFSFPLVGLGTYRVGVAALGYEYQETSVNVTGLAVTVNFVLRLETNGGRWSIVGNTDPELLGGSGSGSLLPTGEVFFCHDTEEPIVFDPISGLKWYPPTSDTAQGCHIVTLNTDGGLFFAGGSMGGNPLDPVVKIAKDYWRNTNSWVYYADMNTGRWYPGMVRLPDERLLVLGGELNDPGYGRTNGCEIYNPRSNSWTLTGSFNLPTEIPPALVLFTGEVLKTWRYPELYNISSGTWRAAANMIQPRRGAANGDHADHEIVHLPDGRVMAMGILPVTTSPTNRFCEFYNPSNNTWTLGANPRALRGRPEALILPDGRVLAFGGEYSGTNPAPVALANAGTIQNCTKVTDLFDPSLNSWRSLSDLNRFIHYHSVTVLVPDGRVINTGGAGLTANRSFAGDDSSIEAFEPPYLFRGVRPRIDSLSTTDLVLGSNFSLRVSLTEAITKLVLVSARATTHWVDGGPARFLSLDFTQSGSLVESTIPNDPIQALAGYYLLFAMVDDIPSIGRIVRITPAPTARPNLPSVSVTALDATAREQDADTGLFHVARGGSTNAPLTVSYVLSGSAVNGTDYSSVSNFVLIPAGAAFANVTISPIDDSFAEGDETVSVSLYDTAGYNVGASTNALVNLLDNDTNVPPLALQISSPPTNRFELMLTGPANRLVEIQASTNLTSWESWTTLVNSNGTARVIEAIPANHPHWSFRALQKN